MNRFLLLFVLFFTMQSQCAAEKPKKPDTKPTELDLKLFAACEKLDKDAVQSLITAKANVHAVDNYQGVLYRVYAATQKAWDEDKNFPCEKGTDIAQILANAGAPHVEQILRHFIYRNPFRITYLTDEKLIKEFSEPQLETQLALLALDNLGWDVKLTPKNALGAPKKDEEKKPTE